MQLRTCLILLGVAAVLTLLVSIAHAQWGSALLEQVTSGTSNDHLGRSTLAMDDQETLHLIYDQWVSAGQHRFYYKIKVAGGNWTYSVPVGNQGSVSSPYLAVDETTGLAYLVYLENGGLVLARGNLELFAYQILPTPEATALFTPAVAVDANGYAHIAVAAQTAQGYKLGYGYWDLTTFHFQILWNSQLGDFGSGATPDICVTSDGGVAISYRGGGYQNYQINTAENYTLGSTTWDIQEISQPSWQCYETSIKVLPNNHLYLAYSGDEGWGFPGRIFLTHKGSGPATWPSPLLVSNNFSGVSPKLAVADNAICHIVFQERSGNILTGNICYTGNALGTYVAQYLQQGGNKYDPSLVIDPFGNCSMAFRLEVTYQDNDVYYYGYVQSGNLPNVTINLTPQPYIPPTIIFTVQLENLEPDTVQVDAWTMARLPNGLLYGPLLNAPNLQLLPNQTVSRLRTQTIPSTAPPGQYWYIGYVGDYPNLVTDADSFSFTVTTPEAGAENPATEWTCFESETGGIEQVSTTNVTPHDVSLSVSPNPFNPSTVASFELRVPSHVSFRVYDTTSRLVKTLVEGWREAGEYQVTFDGSSLPSGVYLYRMEAGEQVAIGKMVLLK